jgi:hypothetical protein
MDPSGQAFFTVNLHFCPSLPSRNHCVWLYPNAFLSILTGSARALVQLSKSHLRFYLTFFSIDALPGQCWQSLFRRQRLLHCAPRFPRSCPVHLDVDCLGLCQPGGKILPCEGFMVEITRDKTPTHSPSIRIPENAGQIKRLVILGQFSPRLVLPCGQKIFLSLYQDVAIAFVLAASSSSFNSCTP